MKYSNIWASSIIFFNFPLIFSANILVFLPMPFTSHTRSFKPLIKELALRGHNVTFYTGTPFSEKIPNLNQIVIRDFFGEYLRKY